MRWSVFVAILLTLCLLPPGEASAGKKNKGNRITVGPSGQFATIQEGVDAAQDGDQVLVEEGTYNESVVIAGKQNFVLAGARNNTNVIGTTSHAIALGPGGGLTTTITADDTQEHPVGEGGSDAAGVDAGGDGVCDTTAGGDDNQAIPVGRGMANATGADAGADGICESTASGDDAQVVTLGQGFPDTSCVTAGSNGTLETAPAVNDDFLDAGSNRITTGADGICDTTKSGDDVQSIPVGNGAADSVCVDTGADGINDTTAVGDDNQAIPVGQGEANATCTDTGADRVSDTTAAGDDSQIIPVGEGLPFTQCVGRGPNGDFETTPAGDDDIRIFGPFGIFGEFISSGADGICDTLAVGGDDVVATNLEEITSGADGICVTTAGTDETQVIPVGNGEPDTDCVTAGADATLDTAVPSGDDVLDIPGDRITSGPDGVCDTTADPNDAQALPVGQGEPNAVCITADNPLVKGRSVKIQNFGVGAPNGSDGIHVERSDFVEIAGITADGSLTGGAFPTGRIGIFVDFRSIKPVIKTSTARFWGNSGFSVQGPSAQISSSVSESNGRFGFFQEVTSTGALLIGNTAIGNTIAGFEVRGSVSILQRCVAQQNLGDGFRMGGAGSILFQVTSFDNNVGVRAFGTATRIRSSRISNNTETGIIIERNPDPAFPEQVPVGSEVFSNNIENNAKGGIEIRTFGVVVRRNQIGPRKLTGAGRQDVGVNLTDEARGTLLEDNKLQNNFDVDGLLCPPAGTICDLVNDGSNNAGKNNRFTPLSVPPPGFQ